MKPKKLDHQRLSRNLGSTIRGRVTAGPGYFGALQLAESVRERFRPPAGGGRARDRGWTMKRLIPVRPETLVRLQRLAAEVSDLVDSRVEPLQVAALIIEHDLESMTDDELENRAVTTHPTFQAIMRRAGARYRTEGGLSTEQVRRRLVARRAARRKR